MKVIFLPTAEVVCEVNKFVCEQGGNPHHCYDIGKVESAISTAFYPGTYPFAHGGLAKVAGALCFYLVKSHAFMDGNKRTGALVAITFLNQHGIDLKYPLDEEKGINALAEVIEKCASSKLEKDELIEWFEVHKVKS
ncbi:MAG: type II toxin-antitoxin system death-on-curing family toxin [Bdellovibrionales bacterium]|nr:type II toxin-antitoxin system death-on-curing family toxin [Bdellovibrionales bacterium]